MERILGLICALLIIPNIMKNSIDNSKPLDTTGMNISISAYSFDETYKLLTNILKNNPNLKVIKEVNHSENAKSVALKLPNTKVVFFGNPNLGTPLMQKNQLTALDLPQKILLFEHEESVYVAYNDAGYLGSRHGVNTVGTLEKISGALKNITAKTTEASVEANTTNVMPSEGIISIVSKNNFETTTDRLRNSIDANENLRLVAEVNHHKNAANVGLELRPTSLFVFGNPNLGTLLMQESRTTAIDLPQKILVWENAEGIVHISFNSPKYLATRHHITNHTEIITKISGALNNLSSNAASVD